MAKDINYSPEQHDSFSDNITYQWWCPKCCTYHSYHYGLYGGISGCPYDDYKYCPHCGQAIRRDNSDGGWE